VARYLLQSGASQPHSASSTEAAGTASLAEVAAASATDQVAQPVPLTLLHLEWSVANLASTGVIWWQSYPVGMLKSWTS
jgi:hypothetical protein